MRTLVTGGAGFLGRPVVAALLARGDDVVVLDDLSTGRGELLDPGARLVVADVADAAAVVAASEGCEAVVHLAAARAVPRSLADPVGTDRTNTGGTVAVLDAARRAGARRVVLASSSSVYGDAERLPTPETAALRPRSPYAVSKLAAEHHARVASAVFGLETVALRYFNLFGPGQALDMAHPTLVPALLGALLDGRPPVLHDGGRRRRDLTFVDDAVGATLAALDAPAERVTGLAVNVGTGRSHKVRDVLAALQRLTGVQADPEVLPARPGDVAATCADPRLARRILGFRAAVDLEAGLRRTVAGVAGTTVADDASGATAPVRPAA